MVEHKRAPVTRKNFNTEFPIGTSFRAYSPARREDLDLLRLRSDSEWLLSRQDSPPGILSMKFVRSDGEVVEATGEMQWIPGNTHFNGAVLVDSEGFFKFYFDTPPEHAPRNNSDNKFVKAIVKVYEGGWLEGLYHVVQQELLTQ